MKGTKNALTSRQCLNVFSIRIDMFRQVWSIALRLIVSLFPQEAGTTLRNSPPDPSKPDGDVVNFVMFKIGLEITKLNMYERGPRYVSLTKSDRQLTAAFADRQHEITCRLNYFDSFKAW